MDLKIHFNEKKIIQHNYHYVLLVLLMVYSGYLVWYLYTNIYVVVFGKQQSIQTNPREKNVFNENKYEQLSQKITEKEKIGLSEDPNKVNNPFRIEEANNTAGTLTTPPAPSPAKPQ